jgi:predicted metal-dependent phosphotriesterase family hydrolase
VKKIVEMIAKAKGVVLATGHISPEESIALIDEAKSKGIEHVVVTHVSSTIIGATIEQQKIMAKKGAILEHVWTICLPRPDRLGQHPSEISDAIKAVGAKHCVMGTDLGNYYHHPVDGFRSYILHMKALGISDGDIDIMTRENPARILGL